MYNVKVPPDANIPPPVSATSASCVFKKKITILLNKYKSAELQSKEVVLWKISVTFPINIGGRRRTRRKSLFISGFTMSTLCSRCNKNYIICVTMPMSTFQYFFLLNFPFLANTPFWLDWIISEVLARARREFSGYFGASQRSSRVPPFLPSNTFLCRCLCLCPFLPSHFYRTQVRS